MSENGTKVGVEPPAAEHGDIDALVDIAFNEISSRVGKSWWLEKWNVGNVINTRFIGDVRDAAVARLADRLTPLGRGYGKSSLYRFAKFADRFSRADIEELSSLAEKAGTTFRVFTRLVDVAGEVDGHEEAMARAREIVQGAEFARLERRTAPTSASSEVGERSDPPESASAEPYATLEPEVVGADAEGGRAENNEGDWLSQGPQDALNRLRRSLHEGLEYAMELRAGITGLWRDPITDGLLDDVRATTETLSEVVDQVRDYYGKLPRRRVSRDRHSKNWKGRRP